LLRGWLRHVESLRSEEEVVHICEPEAGKSLSDGEEERSSRDLRNCQVGGEELSSFQVGNEMGSLEDLIDCQEGRTEIPNFQVGKGSEMRLVDNLMNSEVSSYQQGELMEGDQRFLLIIGGIEVFLPYSPVEAKACVAVATITGEGQPDVTVIEEEKEQILMSTPTEEEHADKMLTPWEEELEMLEDWLNHPEPVDDFHEQTVMHILGEEHSEKLLKNFSQGAEQMTAVPRHATEDESEFQSGEQLGEAGVEPVQGEMEEDNLSEKRTEQQVSQEETAELKSAAEWQVKATRDGENCMGEKHKESQPLEQLEEVIEEIRRLMLRSVQETVSRRMLSRGRPARVAERSNNNNNKAVEQMDNSRG
jgi:hypothetical protein